MDFAQSPAPNTELPLDPLAPLGDALFHRMGVDGVYARTALYLKLLERLESYITGLRDPKAEVMRFPPVMSRHQLEKSGYLQSFPNLLGCVCALHGSESAIRAAVDQQDKNGAWTKSLAASDLVLSPAACYPVYPIAAERGTLPADGWQFDVTHLYAKSGSVSPLKRFAFELRDMVRRQPLPGYHLTIHRLHHGGELFGFVPVPASFSARDSSNQTAAPASKSQREGSHQAVDYL